MSLQNIGYRAFLLIFFFLLFLLITFYSILISFDGSNVTMWSTILSNNTVNIWTLNSSFFKIIHCLSCSIIKLFFREYLGEDIYYWILLILNKSILILLFLNETIVTLYYVYLWRRLTYYFWSVIWLTFNIWFSYILRS